MASLNNVQLNLPYTTHKRASWANTAFLIESLVLLAFVAVSVAVMSMMFAYSVSTTQKAENLSEAVIVAQSAAEEFSSNPYAVANNIKVGAGVVQNGNSSFSVDCSIVQTKTRNGILYTAHISVFPKDDTQAEDEGATYKTTVTRYVSNTEAGVSTNQEVAHE